MPQAWENWLGLVNIYVHDARQTSPPDPWNLPCIALLSGSQSPRGALKSTAQGNT